MCEPCYQRQKNIEEAIEKIKPEARRAAIEKGYNMAIFEDHDGQIRYMEEALAKKIGIEIFDTISYLR